MPTHTVSSYCVSARRLIDEGDYADAVVQCQKAIAVDAQSSEAHMLCGKAYAIMRTDGAEQFLRGAIQLNPASAESWYEYGKLLSDTQSKKAETLLRRALALDMNDGWVHLELAIALDGNNKRLSALNHYERALALLGEHPFVRQGYDRLLSETKVLRNGLPEVEIATRRNPQSCEDAWRMLGHGYTKEGQYELAVAVLTEGCRRYPEHVWLRAALSYAYEFLDLDAAETHLRKAMEIDPKLAGADEALKRIERAKHLTVEELLDSGGDGPGDWMAQLPPRKSPNGDSGRRAGEK